MKIKKLICLIFGHKMIKSGSGMRIKHTCKRCGYYIQTYWDFKTNNGLVLLKKNLKKKRRFMNKDYIKHHLKQKNYALVWQEIEPTFSLILGIVVVGVIVWLIIGGKR